MNATPAGKIRRISSSELEKTPAWPPAHQERQALRCGIYAAAIHFVERLMIGTKRNNNPRPAHAELYAQYPDPRRNLKASTRECHHDDYGC